MRGGSFNYLLKEGMRNLWSNRLMTMASIGVLICCMLLVGCSYVFSENVYNILNDVENKNTVYVFFNNEVELEEASEICENVRAFTNVAKCELVPKSEGLERLRKSLGKNGDLLDSYKDDNPLVHSLEVQVDDLSKYDATIYQIEKIPQIKSIRDQRQLAEKLTSIRQIVMLAGIWIIVLFLLVSLFILSNTVKLTMYARRLEIGIMRSVGATNGFIKLPFVVEGVLMGIAAGIVTEFIVWIIYRTIRSGISEALNIPIIPFREVAFIIFAGFIIMGIAVGALGSLISIRRYLKEEGSEQIG